MPIFVWNVPLVSPIFLKRSLVLPILFSSASVHCSLKKASLSLYAILWSFAFRWVYLSLSPLPFTSLLFSAICEASSDNHFAFLHFFFFGMVLVTTSLQYYEPPSKVLQACCISDLILWIYLSPPLYNRKGFDWGHTWICYARKKGHASLLSSWHSSQYLAVC